MAQLRMPERSGIAYACSMGVQCSLHCAVVLVPIVLPLGYIVTLHKTRTVYLQLAALFGSDMCWAVQMTPGTGSISTPAQLGTRTKGLSCNGWEQQTGMMLLSFHQTGHRKSAMPYWRCPSFAFKFCTFRSLQH